MCFWYYMVKLGYKIHVFIERIFQIIIQCRQDDENLKTLFYLWQIKTLYYTFCILDSLNKTFQRNLSGGSILEFCIYIDINITILSTAILIREIINVFSSLYRRSCFEDWQVRHLYDNKNWNRQSKFYLSWIIYIFFNFLKMFHINMCIYRNANGILSSFNMISVSQGSERTIILRKSLLHANSNTCTHGL